MTTLDPNQSTASRTPASCDVCRSDGARDVDIIVGFVVWLPSIMAFSLGGAVTLGNGFLLAAVCVLAPVVVSLFLSMGTARRLALVDALKRGLVAVGVLRAR